MMGSGTGIPHGEDARHGGGVALPSVGFSDQLFFPRRGERVDPHASFRVRRAPSRANEAFALEPVEPLIERGAINRELTAAPVGEELGDGVSMHGFPRESLQNEHVHRALEAFRGSRHASTHVLIDHHMIYQRRRIATSIPSTRYGVSTAA